MMLLSDLIQIPGSVRQRPDGRWTPTTCRPRPAPWWRRRQPGRRIPLSDFAAVATQSMDPRGTTHCALNGG